MIFAMKFATRFLLLASTLAPIEAVAAGRETVVVGPHAGAELGMSSTAGDLDGDGGVDLVVGTDGYVRPDGRRTGAAWILRGRHGFPAKIDLGSPPDWVVPILGAQKGGGLGEAVVTGDFDGDGFADAALGDALSSEVWIVWGGRSSADHRSLDPSGRRGDANRRPLRQRGGSRPFGGRLRRGRRRRPRDRRPARKRPGRAPPGRGRGLGALRLDETVAGPRPLLVGPRRHDRLLRSRCRRAARLEPRGRRSRRRRSVRSVRRSPEGRGGSLKRPEAGEVAVLFGTGGRPSVIDLAFPPAGMRWTRVVGAALMDRAGWAVGAGDVDGDGWIDLVIGARQADSVPVPLGPGEVDVVFGESRLPETVDLAAPRSVRTSRILGELDGDLTGTSVGAADLDGDGLADILIGAIGAGFGRGASGSSRGAAISRRFSSCEAMAATATNRESSGSTGTARPAGVTRRRLRRRPPRRPRDRQPECLLVEGGDPDRVRASPRGRRPPGAGALARRPLSPRPAPAERPDRNARAAPERSPVRSPT